MRYNSGYVIFDFENSVIDETIVTDSSSTNITKLFSQKNIFKRLSKAIKANKTILITNLLYDKVNKYPTTTFKSSDYFFNMCYEDIPLKFNDSDTILIHLGNEFMYTLSDIGYIIFDLYLVVNAKDEVGVFK